MKIKGSRILITGGAGFIGSHVAESLVEAGAEVTVFDNFSTGLMDNISPWEKEIKIIRGDILDYQKLKNAFKGMDIISHHAAQLEIFLSSCHPEKDLEVNTIGTLNVLKACKESGIKKLINISSACVYGQTQNATKENDDPTPNWPYGVSKLAAEKYARIFNDYENLPVISLRYGIVYGEREWYRRVLPIFLKKIILNQPPVVFGDGRQIRDFIYVKDLVEFHNLCIERDNLNGEVFNVGSGKPTSISGLAETAVKLSSEGLKVIYEDTIEGEFSKLVPEKKRNTAELKTMLLNMSKVEKLTGWKAKTSLIDGLKKEYLWAKDNLSRWEKVLYTVV